METTTISTTEKLSASRWMVLTIIVLAQFQLQLVTFAPALVASPIVSDLQLNRTEFGLIMSALNITIMICQVLGSLLVDRAGPKLGLFSGVALRYHTGPRYGRPKNRGQIIFSIIATLR
jgi:MFS family permease